MGLDVGLYKIADIKDYEVKTGQYNKKSEELWNKATKNGAITISDEEKQDMHSKLDKFAEKLGLMKGGDYKEQERIEINSKKYPEHMFKIGYFRSSYNEGGLNSVLDKIGIKGLYYVFDPNDKYMFVPNWDEALLRIDEILDEINKFKNTPISEYSVASVSFNWAKNIDEKDALVLFEKELKEYNGKGFGSYSNNVGEFYLDKPLQVAGVIQHKKDDMKECFLNENKTFLIYKVDKDFYDWYIQALMIVKETIEFVIATREQEKYVLSWWG